jgi:hypothetical protein
MGRHILISDSFAGLNAQALFQTMQIFLFFNKSKKSIYVS